MTASKPYFNVEGLAFQTPGDPIALGLRDITDEDYCQRLAVRACNTLAATS